MVTECPSTAELWALAEKQSNCSEIDHSCTERPPRYHCVIHENQQVFVEGCFREWNSQGFCLQYNPARDRLQSDYSRKCAEMIPPCPTVFVSTEIYKYPQCNILPATTPKQMLARPATTPTYVENPYTIDETTMNAVLVIFVPLWTISLYGDFTITFEWPHISTYTRNSWSLSSECHLYCDKEIPFIKVIFEDSCHSRLLPSV
uniref:Uncharacterized protein LOC111101429 n=1 Tax=Crassostrea virginica TaxID=6565 RepID=A0A8B8ADV5_CRAVI|nr:uncharacterized protein LOC111101429 [Crassostrea virginica]